jgi:hypothetical protein
MIGVTAFGLILTPVFYVVSGWLRAEADAATEVGFGVPLSIELVEVVECV